MRLKFGLRHSLILATLPAKTTHDVTGETLYLPHMALERTNPMHLRRRTRGSSALTGMGKHGPLASQVSLQLRPSLNLAWATAVGTKSMSWSINCPHCISMWLYVSSGVTRDVDRTLIDTSRALGSLTPLYSRPVSQPVCIVL